MKIVLVCFAAMSTSMLVSRMQKIAIQKDIDAEIVAIPMSEIYDQLG